jgi:hypothetical protein
MLVVAVGNDDIALDQRIVEPYAAGRRGTHRSSAIFGGANSSGGHGSVGGVGVSMSARACLGDSTRDCPTDLLRARTGRHPAKSNRIVQVRDSAK